MDETRIARALRQGPPFHTPYAHRPLQLASETGPHSSGLLVLVAVAVLLVVAVGGAALVGSGVVPLPVPTAPPVQPDISTAPIPRAESTWTATGSMSTPLNGPTVLLADGRVLVAGGSDEIGIERVASELYDPRTGSWIATGELLEARAGATAALLPDGRVLLSGGARGRSDLASAELFEPSTGTWTATGNMHEARAGHTATLLPDGRVLVAGGSVSNSDMWRSLASTELYDPRTGAWTAAEPMSEARLGHTATLLPDGRVLVAGGSPGRNLGDVASAEIFDPSEGSWTATGGMTRARGGGHTATLLADGTVLVAGSGTSAELYDPATGSWTATGNMIGHRGGHTATLLPDGAVLVAGGADGSGDHHVTNTAELYDPISRTWTATAPLAGDRKGHTATLMADGRVLVTGGTDHPTSTGWHWLATAEVYGPARGN